jgi:small subunit ribosomal protein S16
MHRKGLRRYIASGVTSRKLPSLAACAIINPMLMIRLQRVGRKHDPSFRVVLTDRRNSTKSGRFAEVLGFYDARKNQPTFEADRIKYWMDRGAQLTETVNNLLLDAKVIEGKKMNVMARATGRKVKGDKKAAAPAPTKS